MKLFANDQPKLLDPLTGQIEAAAEILGSKWTALILRDVASGHCRFCTLEKTVGKINPRTLSKRLDDLEAQGIITKTTYPEAPPRVEYSLTKKGEGLLPILEQMAAWGDKYAA